MPLFRGKEKTGYSHSLLPAYLAEIKQNPRLTSMEAPPDILIHATHEPAEAWACRDACRGYVQGSWGRQVPHVGFLLFSIFRGDQYSTPGSTCSRDHHR